MFSQFRDIFSFVFRDEERSQEKVDIIEDLSEITISEEVIEDWTEGNPTPIKDRSNGTINRILGRYR